MVASFAVFPTLVIFLAVYCACAEDPTIVKTEYGPIQGLLVGDGVRVFRSIPYAAPPVGDKRWTNTEPPTPWTNVLDCTEEVVGCPQQCYHLPLDATECPQYQSEDCLYLNVWTPISANNESNLNVLLFIHGGGFQTGYSGGLIYNGTQLVNVTNTIVVTINYRLGALGSLYDEELGLFGNFGYLDQVAAIDWSYRNIRQFGGNPQKIVIFGQSAGAHSVALHLLNTSSVIAGAIMESAPLGLPLRTKESWTTLPATFSSELGCDPQRLRAAERLKCLREANASMVVDAQKAANDNDPQTGYTMHKSGEAWSPTVGTDLIAAQPLLAFQALQYNTEIPWMAGTNSGEGFAFEGPVMLKAQIEKKLYTDFSDVDARKIAEFYNVPEATEEENLMQTYGDIITDMLFRCPTRNLMNSSLSSKHIGFFYHYNYVASFVEHVYYWNPNCWEHVCHTEELPIVFDPNATSIDVHPTAEEVVLSHQIQYYWANFAETGNPSAGRHADKLQEVWTDFATNVVQRTLMINDVGKRGIVMNDAPDTTACDFWDSLGYNWYNGTA